MTDCPFNFNNGRINLWDECCPSTDNGFVKSLQFSPDGLCTISATENNTAVICSLASTCVHELSYYGSGSDNTRSESSHSRVDAKIPIGEAIYDLKWYPGMQSNNPGTKCFISTSRDHPIILWDAGSDMDKASVRCTYRGYDLADELDSAISLTFNLAGDKIYAGYERMIRCFDVANPGKDCMQFPTSPTKRARTGQKGLISSLAFNPDYSGAYAAGSYAHSVGVYMENMPECALLFGNIESGVTCLKWSPCGHYLWVGGRNNSNIVCYDIRTTQSIVGSVQRKLTSNQRMSFDLDPWGKYLCTGDQDGKVLFYDTSSFQLVHSIDHSTLNATEGSQHRKSSQGACVNSVAFHPFSALLGVATGERSFVVDTDTSDSESDSGRASDVSTISKDDKDNNGISDGSSAMISDSSAAIGSKQDKPEKIFATMKNAIRNKYTSVSWLQLPYTPLVIPSVLDNAVVQNSDEFNADGDINAAVEVMEVETQVIVE